MLARGLRHRRLQPGVRWLASKSTKGAPSTSSSSPPSPVKTSEEVPWKVEQTEALAPDAALAYARKFLHIDLASTEDIAVAPIFVPGRLSPAFNHPYAKPTVFSRVYYWLHSLFSSRFATAYMVWEMAKYRSWPPSFPPLSTPGAVVTGVFTLGSTRQKAWIATARRAALHTYTQLGNAIAAGDGATVRKYARGAYLQTSLARLPPRRVKYEWRIVRETRPVKCLAWRAQPYDIEHPDAPEPGADVNGFVIHAVFRFDTMQSLRRTGEPPGEPQRVVEHLVLEKRNWLPNEGWKIIAETQPGTWIGDERVMGMVFPDKAKRQKQ